MVQKLIKLYIFASIVLFILHSNRCTTNRHCEEYERAERFVLGGSKTLNSTTFLLRVLCAMHNYKYSLIFDPRSHSNSKLPTFL